MKLQNTSRLKTPWGRVIWFGEYSPPWNALSGTLHPVKFQRNLKAGAIERWFAVPAVYSTVTPEGRF
jgi:hypothetical protein